MTFENKVCEGRQGAKEGCGLTCLKAKAEEKQAARTVLEVAKDARDLFSRYEITAAEAARAKELTDRLEKNSITVSVIGQFKRGKSALVNAILEDKILPVGIVPVTAVVTKLEYGEKAASVRFYNGIVKEITFDEMPAYINEQQNTDNHLGVSEVRLFCPAAFLQKGLTFVDTPGVGSVHQKNSDAAYSYLKESDAVIFVLSVDSPLNQIEIDFLRSAGRFTSKFYFAVNKTDTVDESDLEDYLAYCRDLLIKLTGMQHIRLFPVSARSGTGIAELKTAIEQDSKTAAKEILSSSAKLRLLDIIASARSQIIFYRTALNMSQAEFDLKFKELKQFFTELIKNAGSSVMDFSDDPRMAKAHMNDIKNLLSAKVSELFGIEYHYNIPEIDFFRSGNIAEEMSLNQQGSFTEAVEKVCNELANTLNTIFMHREENAYVVCKRLSDLNRLLEKLITMRDELAG